MGLLLNSVRWDSVFVRYPGPKTHLHVLRPEKNRQFADGPGFNSRHLHQCEVSGHRSVGVPRLFVFWGADVSCLLDTLEFDSGARVYPKVGEIVARCTSP